MAGVLALDCALAVGVAFNGPTPGVPATTTYHCVRPDRAPDGTYRYGGCWLAFGQWLRRTIREVEPEVVACEAPLPVMGRRTKAWKFETTPHIIRLLYGLCAITETTAKSTGVEYAEETATAIKHHFTGNSVASKADMLRRAKLLSWPVHGDDEADAAALWHLVSCKRFPKFRPQIGSLFVGTT